MHRRLVGGLLFVMAMTLAVVVPTFGGHRLEGIGTPIALPEDPRVGDCVLEPLADIIVIPPTSSGSPLAPTFAPCDGRTVAGEVVDVVRGTGDTRDRIDQAEESSVGCYQSTLEYSGLVLEDGRYLLADQPPNDPVDWHLTINVRTAWVVPAPFLQEAGKTWVACIAAPLSGTKFRGQLTKAFSGGKLPAEFGFCWAQSTPSATDPVPCSGRHFAELVSLGTIPAGAGIAFADIQSSCRRLAGQLMGRSDPTAAGRLDVGTSVSPDPAQVTPATPPLHVICYIAPVTQALSGSLVGLGDSPIPYSK